MKRILTLLLSLMFLFSGTTSVLANKTPSMKAAFIRQGNLWTKIDKEEKQITEEGEISTPKWSFDGKWIAYQKKNNQIWVYNLENNKHFQIFHDGGNYQWSPTKNILAFQSQSVLHISDIESDQPRQFENISIGVDDYTWMPDGSGFIASTSAQPLPDGWTNPILYRISLAPHGKPKQIDKFFTIPQPVSNGKVKMLSINASAFVWSHDGRWLSFIVSPTASLSADGNMLCLLSADGKQFKPVELMLNNDNWVQWAPTEQKLAYISGEGRFATKNKAAKVLDVPSMRTTMLTPGSYAERDFTWQNNQRIIISRSKESEWHTDPLQRPMPILYQVNLPNGPQKLITTPPPGFGDFYPQTITLQQRVSWIRTDRKIAQVWLGKEDGSEAGIWISSLDLGSDYYEMWRWNNVFALYTGKSR